MHHAPLTTDPSPSRKQATFKASITADIIRRIELECSCIVTVQRVGDDYDGEWKVRGYYAWANREDEFRPGSTRTVMNADGDTAIEALDKLARRLGYDPDLEAAVRTVEAA